MVGRPTNRPTITSQKKNYNIIFSVPNVSILLSLPCSGRWPAPDSWFRAKAITARCWIRSAGCPSIPRRILPTWPGIVVAVADFAVVVGSDWHWNGCRLHWPMRHRPLRGIRCGSFVVGPALVGGRNLWWTEIDFRGCIFVGTAIRRRGEIPSIKNSCHEKRRRHSPYWKGFTASLYKLLNK